VRFHVFIDGSRDPSPDGTGRLVAILGQRYGMSPAAMADRLAHGPFCARTSLERPAAERLAGELEAIGARVRLASESVDLGALGDGHGGPALQLSTLDGVDDERTVVSPARLQEAVARSTPPSLPPPVPPSRPVRTTPHDPFLPPEMHQAPRLELDVPRHPVPLPATVAGAPMTGPAVFTPISAEGLDGRRRPHRRGSATVYTESLGARIRGALADDPRARFATGVVLAFLVGLVAAQITGSIRRASIDEDLIEELNAAYAAADTPDEWAALDDARADALELVDARQTRYIVSIVTAWLLVGGAVLFVWLRLDFERPRPRLAPGQSPGERAAAARRRATR
jgi:hypothetical protein